MVLSEYVRRVLLGSLLLTLWAVPAISAQTVESWSEPVMLSEEPWFGWFPDVTVDNLGKVHVFWEAADFSRWRLGLENSILYPFGLIHRTWDGRDWSEQNDVIAYMGTEGIIFRLATAVDAGGYVYLTYSRDGVNFVRALAEKSMSAAAWSAPYKMSGGIYMSDVAVDSKNNIHIVYEETIMDPLDESQLASRLSSETPLRSALLVHAEICYRRSEDGGKTWTAPVNLSKTLEGTHRVQIKIDGQDVVYVTWDEGWSRWGSSDRAEPRYGVLVASPDGGRSWSRLATFAYPEGTNAQLATASDGQGGVLAIWRARTTEDIYYVWSTDYGRSWSPESTLPGIYARRWNDNQFDAYDIALDSAGTMHVVLVGRESAERNARGEWEEPALYHLAWNGVSWSRPTLIRRCDEGWRPEYPKIAISRGNQLHVTWFEYNYTERFYIATSRVWYSSHQSAAPEVSLPPTSTPTPIPTLTPSPVAEPTAITMPMPFLESTPLPQELAKSIFTDTDEVLLLAKSLIPVALFIGAVIVGRVVLRRS
jgi:hypothetical protein